MVKLGYMATPTLSDVARELEATGRAKPSYHSGRRRIPARESRSAAAAGTGLTVLRAAEPLAPSVAGTGHSLHEVGPLEEVTLPG